MRNLRLTYLFLGAFIFACGGETSSNETSASQVTEGDESASSGSEEAGLGLPNEHHLLSGLITSGMPDQAALEAARDRGVTTVISLRMLEEPGAAEEAAMVEALGMTFVSVPVDGAEGITEENARAVDAAIGDQEAHTVLHCGSSNRAGAMVALRAFFVQGMAGEAAIDLGREAGLSRSEDAVRAAIDADCETNPDRCAE